MRTERRWKYIGGAAALLLVAAALFAAFSLLSRTELIDYYLGDSSAERFGWRYELLRDGRAQAYEPVFEGIGYTPSLPEGTRAVRAVRTMEEEVPYAELEWFCSGKGVELALDGATYYSDFPQAARGADGFLRLTAEDWEAFDKSIGGGVRRVRSSLPPDYRGRELAVTTYFPEDAQAPTLVYPSIGSENAAAADEIIFAVRSDVTMTVYALLALLIAGMFLLDVSNDDADAKTLLLSLYFLLMFLNGASNSYAGSYSILNSRVHLAVLRWMYPAPLYLYLALRLKRRWRYPLCAAIAVWALYEGARELMRYRSGLVEVADSVGPWSLMLLLAVVVATCAEALGRGGQIRRRKRRVLFYGVVAAVALLVCALVRIHYWGSVQDYLAAVWSSLHLGNFESVVSLATDAMAIVALVAMVSEFVRRTLRTRQEMSVLQDRARQTVESYNRLLTAQEAIGALHHEMRHHMTAISGMLKGGDADRAIRYADAVAGDLDRLPVGRYSQNLLVNVIAGSYLDRAWARGIRVEHRLNLPPELPIADEDLSVFLSNLLQNALEACERMDPASERSIQLEMRMNASFLFVSCVNSAPERDVEAERPGHGYGLTAMRRIAEKYNSVLVIERAPGKFAVKSDLCLPEN